MALLVAQTITRSGLNPAYAAAAGGGDTFANTGTEYIHIKNGDASSINVTFVTTATADGLATADRVVAVPGNGERIIGPFPKATYNDEDGILSITYSAVTSVTVGVFKT